MALPDPAERPTLTIPETARLLGVSRSCAYEAAKRGQLPIIKIAGRRLVLTAKLLDLLGLTVAMPKPRGARPT
ncbi:helix-turn-helix domain-containing protein [Actinomadura gamaensis]|uniref:Helix-turn-helix domain-containing protein n=1 Tax=Actinomadura gamaensis TaxID=1763541 RepID=A0ABV9TTP8_9ACTN